MDTATSPPTTLPAKTQRMTPEQRALEYQSFEIAFESLLDEVSNGTSLTLFAQNYHTALSPGRFRTWIWQKENRRNAYLMAKTVGAEHVEDEMLRIADGIDANGNASPNDTNRATLQVNTRKWLLQVWNRKRYGDTKHIEQVTTQRIDASSLSSDDLRQRLMRSLQLDQLDSIDNSIDTFEDVGNDDDI
jgi:hypothetical protein